VAHEIESMDLALGVLGSSRLARIQGCSWYSRGVSMRTNIAQHQDLLDVGFVLGVEEGRIWCILRMCAGAGHTGVLRN
jgi:hypothetical protein